MAVPGYNLNMFLRYLLVCFILILGGCIQESSAEVIQPTPSSTLEESPMTDLIVKSEPLRFLALGDSYTIGQDVLPSGRWPVQLVERLRKFEVSNGRCGNYCTHRLDYC
jgi:hypothetical protein